MSKKVLIVLTGDSFRCRNDIEDVEIRQKIATISHLELVETIKNKYNIDTEFLINTYKTTPYNDSLIKKWYGNKSVILNIGDRLSSEFESIHNTIELLKNINLDDYINVLFIRMDLYLKPYFINNFNIQTDKIYYAHVDTNHQMRNSSMYPSVYHGITLVPQKYFDLILKKIVWNYHQSLMNTLQHIGKENVLFYINSIHYCDTFYEWNPLYTYVGRKEASDYLSKGKYYNYEENKFIEKENDNTYDDIFLKNTIQENIELIKLNLYDKIKLIENDNTNDDTNDNTNDDTNDNTNDDIFVKDTIQEKNEVINLNSYDKIKLIE
jgi:hypothetical protein